jgi:ABC-2 type transport system permease protein
VSARAYPVSAQLRLMVAAAAAVGRTKIQTSGLFFYILVWMTFPVFNLFLVALIYRHNESLRDYAIVGGAGMALLFGMQFNAGEILDNERQRGTLGNLFLAPVPRYAWLAGFQLFAFAEAVSAAAITVAGGALAFGVHLAINPLAFVLTLLLFVACMWGFSMIVGSIGVAVRDANQLSNLVFTPVSLLAGTMLPVALMPLWLRIPARGLPFGYGIQALVGASTKNASVAALWRDLLPLAGFAVLLPVIGIIAFDRVERLARRRGVLDLV